MAGPDAIAATEASANQIKSFLAKRRSEMRRVRSTAAAEAGLGSLQRRALENIRAEKVNTISELVARTSAAVSAPRDFNSLDPYPHAGAVLTQSGGGWVLNPTLARAFEGAAEAARRSAQAPVKKKGLSDRLFGAGEGNRAQQVQGSIDTMARVVASVTRAITEIDSEELRTTTRRQTEGQALRQKAEEELTAMLSRHADIQTALPAFALPWPNEAWDEWQPRQEQPQPEMFAGVLRPRHDAELGENGDFGRDVVLPFFVRPMFGLHLITNKGNRQATQELARSLLVRSLAAHAPGTLHLTVFDPIGLGQSVSSILELGEYDPEILGGKVWSGASDFKDKLRELTAHIELVVQKFLRSDYGSLAEFNAAAGDIATPYRLLVVFDFPAHFDQESFNDLRRIVETGPRCGVGTLLVTNGDEPLPHGVALAALPSTMTRVNMAAPFSYKGPSGEELVCDFQPESDRALPGALLDRIIKGVGSQARAGSDRSVGFDKLLDLFSDVAIRGIKPGLPNLSSRLDATDRATWWRESTTRGVAAPIGQAGARDVATLMFDSSNHSGALLVGRPGSGKSTLLHSFIAAATLLFSPEELELHLIDFKEGVEFKSYASYGLPHARSVAIESDREFGFSVLQALQSELNWRAELLRDSEGAHASLEALRAKSGARIPRIVLVFDEFQVLFARNDRLGAEAAAVLESLIRQGRGFGIHVLLASQSLSGLDALGSHVPQLLPVRILLPASEADALRVLGEGNTAGSLLLQAGDGVLNTAGGSVEANQPFRGALLPEERRNDLLRRLREFADEAGFLRHPVVFEGDKPLRAEDTPPGRFVDEIRGARARTLRIRFGVPMAISGSADIDLRREAGANVVLVARDATSGTALGDVSGHALPHAVASNAVASAVAARARVEIADFLPIEDGLDDALAPFREEGRLAIYRRRQVPELLGRVEGVVRERIDADDVDAEPLLLVLFGIHRARDFDTESVDFDPENDLASRLATIVRDGPEVGVHTLIWCETLATLSRRLGSGVTRECSWRLAGRMSADDSHSLIGVDTASGLREQQIIIANEDIGRLQRCTSLSQPSAGWVRDLLCVVNGSPKEG